MNGIIPVLTQLWIPNLKLHGQGRDDEALANNENWGPLHGLPMTIKDYINVTGFHTTYGSPMFKDYLPTTNADVVQPLIDAGAIIFGKTNLPLWATGSQSFNEVYGQTNNPWDLTRTPGGSSGGAAAALAAEKGAVLFGHLDLK
jgi:amidase